MRRCLLRMMLMASKERRSQRTTGSYETTLKSRTRVRIKIPFKQSNCPAAHISLQRHRLFPQDRDSSRPTSAHSLSARPGAHSASADCHSNFRHSRDDH